jgi:proline iminopeptidase
LHLVREGYAPVPGGRLYWREVGTGPSVIVVHGGPDFNHNYLLPELDLLAAAFRLIYYDQRGRGLSSPGFAAESVSLESEVDDLDTIRRCFGLDRAVLLGHSFGAIIAMEYAIRHPVRVAQLILMNPAPASHADVMLFHDRRRATESAALATMKAIAETPEYLAGDIAAEADYYRAHFANALRRPDQVEGVVRRLRAHFTPADIVKARAIEDRLNAQTWELPDYSAIDRLRGLGIPTLVIHGENDFAPVECATHIADTVAGSQLVIVPECGHFAYLECPAQAHDALVAFARPR